MGLVPRPLLTHGDLASTGGAGGLVVVGSYVPKRTEQLSRLLAAGSVSPVELAVTDVLNGATAHGHVRRRALGQ